jgi:hypothetical protein
LTPVITQLRCAKKAQINHPLTEAKTNKLEELLFKPAAHSEMVAPVKVKKCLPCYETFSQPSTPRLHVKAGHESNKCSVCDKTFLSSSYLRMHLK